MANSIHPTAIIGSGVELGTGNTIGPFCVITGPATLGDDNWIGSGVVIGAPPEVRGFDLSSDPAGPDNGAGVRIGNRNVLREYVQVHQGWRAVTSIGDDAFIMNQSYIAHDCRVGSGVTLASSSLLAGHVVVEEFSNLGLGSTVHQGRFIGAGSMVGMGSVITRDVPPFAKAFGNPASVRGVNRVGLTRRGVADDVIDSLEEVYASSRDRWNLEAFISLPEVGGQIASWLARPAAG